MEYVLNDKGLIEERITQIFVNRVFTPEEFDEMVAKKQKEVVEFDPAPILAEKQASLDEVTQAQISIKASLEKGINEQPTTPIK